MAKISVVHATARLDGGYIPAIYNLIDNSDEEVNIEYILAVDDPNFRLHDTTEYLVDKLVYVNTSIGLDGCIRAYNSGAEVAIGDVILLHSDDMFLPQDWDKMLLEAIGDRINEDFVVRCKSGHTNLITFQILSRKRYERLGYALYPGYHSLWADNEFTAHAEQDGVVIEAPHIEIEHRHPIYNKAQWDEVYHKENNRTWAEHGRKLFIERQALGFPCQVT